MFGVGEEDLSGRHLLEGMALHAGRGAANVVGRSGAVWAEQEGEGLCMWSSV